LTQRGLAGERYSGPYVSTVESGRRRPSTDALAYFAERLGVDAGELATGRPAQLGAVLRLRLADARRAAAAGDLVAAVRTYESVRAQAEARGLGRLLAQARQGLARCAERDGDLDAAAGHLAAAEADLAGEALAVRVPVIVARARLRRLAGDARDTAYVLETTLDRLVSEGLADPEAIVQLQYGLVGAYMDLGRPDRAVAAAVAAMTLAGDVADPERLADMYVQVARTHLDQGRWADAEAALDRAHDTYRRLDFLVETALCHWAQGSLLCRDGRYAEAAAELRTARDMLRTLGSRPHAGQVAPELAAALHGLGRTGEAMAALDDAWLLSRDDPDLALPVAEAHRIRGRIAADAADPALAETHLRAALDGYLAAGAGAAAAAAARQLGDLLRAAGREPDAVEVYRRGLAAVERSGLVPVDLTRTVATATRA